MSGEDYECSRAACRNRATHQVIWRNPRIHAEDRQKIWLACDAHLPVLRAFLEDRSFPVNVVAAGDLDE